MSFNIHTEWTENRTTWNKGAHGVLQGVKSIENALPFKIRGFDCDNGSEFINYHLLHYLQKREQPVQFTRSRPYRKNDNAHVEQRNWTHVRQLFGYSRFEKPALVDLMNDLYSKEWSWFNNFFCPSMKLIEKIKINSRYRKKYTQPMTPYQRVMLSDSVSDCVKQRLSKQFNSLDPFELRNTIQDKLKAIFKLSGLTKQPRKKI